MQKQKRSQSRNNSASINQGPGFSSMNIHNNVSLSSSAGTKTPTQVDSDFRLSIRVLEHHPVTLPATNQKKVCTEWKESVSHSIVSDSLLPHGLKPIMFLCPGDFTGKKCSGLPFPSPGDLPDSGIEPRSSALQADSLPSELPGKPRPLRASNPLRLYSGGDE